MKRHEPPSFISAAPWWLEPKRVLTGTEVLIHCEHTHFRLNGHTVVLGQQGVFVPAPVMLREGSAVRVELSWEGQRLELDATVESAPSGLGTILHFLPLSYLARRQLQKFLEEGPCAGPLPNS